jgi:hypothetical protein
MWPSSMCPRCPVEDAHNSTRPPRLRPAQYDTYARTEVPQNAHGAAAKECHRPPGAWSLSSEELAYLSDRA